MKAIGLLIFSIFFIFSNQKSFANQEYVSIWQDHINKAYSLKSCLEKKIGKHLISRNESDIDKIKTCNVGGNSDLFMYSFFLVKNARNTKYVTNFKSFLIMGMENQIKTHFSYSSENELVGAIKFKFDKGNSYYIPSEAPLDEELFMNTVWDNDIDTYVTLTNDDDNDPLKLRFLRGFTSLKIDLHHLENLYKKKIYGFSIRKPKIMKENDVYIIQSEIVNHINKEKRILTHIKTAKWNDAKDLDLTKLNHLVSIINKYRRSRDNPLFVNCFAGIGRTRALIMALHAKELRDTGINVDPSKISKEYFMKNYNSNITKTGEFLIGYRKDCSNDQYLMFEKYCLSLK